MKWALLFAALLFLSCENPFAPRLATTQVAPKGFLADQKSVDGVFQNFVYAYTFRDTSVYSQIIGPNFTFVYRDYDNSPPQDVAWGRDVEMRSTSAMFQLVNRLVLIWDNTYPIDSTSTHAVVTRGFSLTVSFNPADIEDVAGKAYFVFDRASASDPWRISMWRDESNF